MQQKVNNCNQLKEYIYISCSANVIFQTKTQLYFNASAYELGKIWQKHWRKNGRQFLPECSFGRNSDVGVRADRGCGIQVISADVIQGVAETTAHGTAVIPAKDRQWQ